MQNALIKNVKENSTWSIDHRVCDALMVIVGISVVMGVSYLAHLPLTTSNLHLGEKLINFNAYDNQFSNCVLITSHSHPDKS